MTPDSLAAALGRIPSGIFILTTRHHGRETGMLASWVQQAGFQPPMISFAVGRGRYLAEWISDGAPVVINVVGHSQTALLKHFGRGFEPDQSAFEGRTIRRTAAEVPILEEALAFLECQTRGHVDSGDHRIFLAEVTAGGLLGAGEPMVHIRRNGLNY